MTDNYASFDVVEFSLAEICQAAGLPNSDVESEPRLQLLEEHDLLDDGYVIPRPSPTDTLQDILPMELVALLTTLCQSPEEFEQRRSKNKPPKLAMETAQAGLLYKVLQTKQSHYATSLAHDMQLLSSLTSPALEGSSRRLKMALQVRIGEKEILQAIQRMLDSLTSNGSLKRTANGDHDSRQSKSVRV